MGSFINRYSAVEAVNIKSGGHSYFYCTNSQDGDNALKRQARYGYNNNIDVSQFSRLMISVKINKTIFIKFGDIGDAEDPPADGFIPITPGVYIVNVPKLPGGKTYLTPLNIHIGEGWAGDGLVMWGM